MKALAIVATVIAFHFAGAAPANGTEPKGIWNGTESKGIWALTANKEEAHAEPGQGNNRNRWSFDDLPEDLPEDLPVPPTQFNEVFWTDCTKPGWDICDDSGLDSCFEGFGCKRSGLRTCRWEGCGGDYDDCWHHRREHWYCHRHFCRKAC